MLHTVALRTPTSLAIWHALADFFALSMSANTMNQVWSGMCVRWKIVPTVTENAL